jgi:TonB family protein
MRRLAACLLILTAAGLPGLAQEPSQAPPEEQSADSPQMHDTQRIALCMAKAKKPLEPSDVEPVRLGKTDRPKVIHSPWPQFRRDQEGRVMIETIIDEDGCVREAKVILSAQKKLDAAALDAVKQWVYRPIKVDGKPVRARHFVTVNFNGRG